MAWIAYGFGIVAFAAIAVLRMAAFSRSWPTAPGRVLSAEEIKSANTLPYAFAYEYTVKGMRYVSGTVALLASEELEQQAARQYPVGSTMTVYYNPREPNRSVLVPGALPRVWKHLGGIAAVSIAIMVLLLWLHSA